MPASTSRARSRSTNRRELSPLSDGLKILKHRVRSVNSARRLAGAAFVVQVFIVFEDRSRFRLNYRTNLPTMAAELLGEIDEKFWKEGRLKTYTSWPFKGDDGTCTPEHMAAAGFFFIGESDDDDSVECFICGKQLDGWEASDNPWQEHAKRQQDCTFIQLNKPNELKWTIEDLFNLMKAFYVRDTTRKMDEVVKLMKLDSDATAKRIPKIYKAARKSRKGGK